MNCTPEERAELRAKAEAATPGEWIDAKDPDRAGWRVINGQRWPIAGRMISQNSAHVAAASPQTVLRLLDDIEEMQRRLDAVARIRAMPDGYYLACSDSPFCRKGDPGEYSKDCAVRIIHDALRAYDAAEAGTA